MNNNRMIIVASVVAVIAIAGYFYWGTDEVQSPVVPEATKTEPVKPK